MKVKMVAIEDVVPYARNPRKNMAAITKVSASLKEFGWQQPIVVDKEMVVIAGHTRLEAAWSLKYKKVPVQIADKLTDAQVKAYRIADNRVSQEAEWDIDLLKLELSDLDGLDYDLLLTGFDDDELNGMLVEAVEGLTDEDEVPPLPENPVSVLSDVWTLGSHRLMCGDSTSVDAVDKLMSGDKADMVFTDPPYNVAFNGRSGKFDIIKNDNLTDEEFSDFINSWLACFEAHRPNTYYVCCNWSFYGIVQDHLKPKACIVWAKNVFGLGKGYRHQHEFILFDGFIDQAIKNESDLWQISKDSKYIHPTQKPVEISERAINNSSKAKNIVLDFFGGSGSTLIACEKTGRHCRMMELDEKYVDVVISRWQDFTGKEAVHAETGKTYNEMKAERHGS
tara:strand:- start:667 stop:1848 length:1182 start_codon:yes stop_codon:yes gene_type:complete